MVHFLKFKNDTGSKIYPLVIIVICMAGIFLRFWLVHENLIFADEIHIVGSVINRSLGWILTHYAESDACIPLTVYSKIIQMGNGLNEFSLRLPSLVAGSLLIVLASYSFFKVFKPLESIIAVGIISLSPYFIYLSREARPYAIIMFLFFLSTGLVFLWMAGKDRIYIIAAFVSLALCLYFHPVVAPAAFILGLYPLVVKLLSKNFDFRKKDYWIAVSIFIFLLIFFMGPPLSSLLKGISEKGVKGQADIATIRNGLTLILGLPVVFPLWVWSIFFFGGTILSFKQFKRETIVIVAMIAFQMLILFVTQPKLIEIPWVWIRYLAHLLPMIIFLSVYGFSGLVKKLLFGISQKSRVFVSLGLVLVGAFFVYHIRNHHYVLKKSDSYNMHPMIQFLPRLLPLQSARNLGSTYYNHLEESLPQGNIIEAPMLFTFPLYSVYQSKHNRQIYSGSIGSGFGQRVFDDKHTYNTVYSLNKINILKMEENGIRFIIIHKHIKDEFREVFNTLRKDPLMATQLNSMANLFSDKLLDVLFGNGDIEFIPENIPKQSPVFEDEYIQIYDILNFT